MPWPTAAIGEIADVVSGATPKTSVADYWDGDIAWATPADLSRLPGAYIDDTPRKITLAGLASCAATILPRGSVLLSSRAPIGHVAINRAAMATNQGFKSLVPKKGVADCRYLYRWLVANKEALKSLGNGVTFKEVSKSVVSQVRLPLPPIDEQRRIADILDRADALRAKRRESLALLDDLTQSIFLDRFGEPLSNPRGLPTATVGEVSNLVTDGEHQTPARSSQGVPLLSARNVRDGYLDLGLVDYVSEAEYQRLRKRIEPREGDVLISCSGSVGRVAQVGSEPPFAMVRSVALVRPDVSAMTPTFLEHQLRAPRMKALMMQRANASSQANLFQKDIRPLPLVVPSINEQRRFDRIVSAARLVEAGHDADRSTLDELFSSLQLRAFAGQL